MFLANKLFQGARPHAGGEGRCAAQALHFHIFVIAEKILHIEKIRLRPDICI
jgi:hypothetical protein